MMLIKDSFFFGNETCPHCGHTDSLMEGFEVVGLPRDSLWCNYCDMEIKKADWDLLIVGNDDDYY